MDTPINIVTGSGSYVHNDNTTSPSLSGTGDGSTAPEQYRAYDPANPASTDPIQAGDTTILRSEQTGQYCRLAPLPTNSSQLGMICDLATAASATPFTYTGSGLSYNGIPLVSTGPGAPLVLANTTTSPVSASGDQLSFPLAGEAAAAHGRAKAQTATTSNGQQQAACSVRSQCYYAHPVARLQATYLHRCSVVTVQLLL